METTPDGEQLKDPQEIAISPLGDIEGLSMSVFMTKFRTTYKSLIDGLTNKTGLYAFQPDDINKVINEYNVPIKGAVYPIFNTKTKEYTYYTAVKKDNTITFTEDKNLTEIIDEQKKALDARFSAIKAVYEAEQKAKAVVLATKFEKLGTSNGAYNLGLYPDDLTIQRNQGKTTILSEAYDPSIVQYFSKIWISDLADDVHKKPPQKKTSDAGVDYDMT